MNNIHRKTHLIQTKPDKSRRKQTPHHASDLVGIAGTWTVQGELSEVVIRPKFRGSVTCALTSLALPEMRRRVSVISGPQNNGILKWRHRLVMPYAYSAHDMSWNFGVETITADVKFTVPSWRQSLAVGLIWLNTIITLIYSHRALFKPATIGVSKTISSKKTLKFFRTCPNFSKIRFQNFSFDSQWKIHGNQLFFWKPIFYNYFWVLRPMLNTFYVGNICFQNLNRLCARTARNLKIL